MNKKELLKRRNLIEEETLAQMPVLPFEDVRPHKKKKKDILIKFITKILKYIAMETSSSEFNFSENDTEITWCFINRFKRDYLSLAQQSEQDFPEKSFKEKFLQDKEIKEEVFESKHADLVRLGLSVAQKYEKTGMGPINLFLIWGRLMQSIVKEQQQKTLTYNIIKGTRANLGCIFSKNSLDFASMFLSVAWKHGKIFADLLEEECKRETEILLGYRKPAQIIIKRGKKNKQYTRDYCD